MAQAVAHGQSPRERRPASRYLSLFGSYTGLLLLTVLFVTPLLWMLSNSLKTNAEATRVEPTWIPENATTQAFETILTRSEQTPVFRWFLNSLIAATAHAFLVVLLASLAAYALARLEFPGKRILFAVIVSTLFVPGIVFLTPSYLIVDSLGWLDSLLAVIVPGAAGAFGVFFLRQFFVSIPQEIEEAALLDGANRLKVYLRIILPLSKPALATLFVLSFLTNWNDFLWPLFVLFSPENLTLPPGLALLRGSYVQEINVIMAGAVVASVPVLILYVFAQRFIVEGVSSAGVKG